MLRFFIKFGKHRWAEAWGLEMKSVEDFMFFLGKDDELFFSWRGGQGGTGERPGFGALAGGMIYFNSNRQYVVVL